jgi:hypothetical protein
MRRLALLALLAISAFPLSAHDHWRGPHRVVVMEEPRPIPYRHFEAWRRDDRWERHAYYRRHDCEEDRLILRPLVLPRPLHTPFEGQVVLQFR